MAGVTGREDAGAIARRLPRLDPAAIGVRVPDSEAAREAEELCRNSSQWFLYAHAMRSYLFAALLGRNDGMAYDEEALYVACVLHDLGLTPAYGEAHRPFEEISADGAVAFLGPFGWASARKQNVRKAIVLHMAAEVGVGESSEAILLAAGVSCDVSGERVEEVELRARQELLRQLPRGEFKRHFAALMQREADQKPGCAADNLIRRGLLDRIVAAPFADDAT